MPETLRSLAIDLGASSGRAVLGTLGADDMLKIVEVSRFANGMLERGGALRWDFEALLRHIVAAISSCRAGHGALATIGVDTWGVDYLLLDAAGRPLEPPVAYRDHRTEGVMERVFDELLPADEIYGITGIQFMPINTLYQLAADVFAGAERLKQARRLLLLPDAFAYFLSGSIAAEYTIASTTQMLDARTRDWSPRILEALGLPVGLLPEVVEPACIAGACTLPVAAGATVVRPAGHDTAAAVAAAPAEADTAWAYISAGTWLLAGVEARQPLLSAEAQAAGLTNEGGACGTYRLLKNITGLWLLQECMRLWRTDDVAGICSAAFTAPPEGALLDPDDPAFLAPPDMPAAIARYCARTRQPFPQDRGALARSIFESLALKTRCVLERIAEGAGVRPHVVHMLGGGSRNALLCRMTAEALGLPVIAGPAEAAAIGNLLLQALAVGRIGSLADCRRIVRMSCQLGRYEPAGDTYWHSRYQRFRELLAGQSA